MRRLLLLICMILSFSEVSLSENKRAILMVHYGTANDTSRARNLDVLNKKVAEAFPGYKVVEAYSSNMVIEALAKRGIQKDHIRESLQKLRQQGYTDVTIQTSDLLDGVMTALIDDVAREMRSDFDTIRIGRPLLWGLDDCRWITKVLTTRISAGSNGIVFLVGHGTEGPANAIYSELDYVLQDMGHKNYHVVTIEGYPNFDNAVKILKEEDHKQVTLYPLLMIAGNHAVKDINGTWRQKLTEMGYQVQVIQEGLGSIKEVQDHLISQIRKLINQ